MKAEEIFQDIIDKRIDGEGETPLLKINPIKLVEFLAKHL